MKAPKAPTVLTAGGFSLGKKKPTKATPAKKLTIKVDEEVGQSTTATSQLHADETAQETSDDTRHSLDEPSDLDRRRLLKIQRASVRLDDLYKAPPVIVEEVSEQKNKSTEFFWLAFCFFGIMGSFVAYGLLLEYATSGGKHLHELSFLFVTSLLYTMTASVGRYVRAETPSTIPPAQFAVLGLTSMGSTFFSVRALRYVIYPIQVLAKSCKPVPVMLMGALMGKKYPPKKYMKVALIVGGVGLFMGGG
jgi:hypothetical protein